MSKEYVFFYHYYKQYNEMSIHFRGKCIRAKDVVCNVPCFTKWNNRQPYLVMKGKCKNVEIKDGIAIIS